MWQLISRVVGYIIFAGNILIFWTVRYRARGMVLGRTILLGAAIFSLILSLAYILSSFGVVASISSEGGLASNLYYFLLSTPQVPLYIFCGVLESILWGSAPERASIGFGMFEIAKVAIGGVAVAVFHLSLTGAILAITGAQIVQLVATLFMTRTEYRDSVSFSIISKMLKTGWVAIMNHIPPLVASLDFLIVAVMTKSTIPIALYGVSYVYASLVTYSNWLAYGLYAGILAGIDPRKSSNEVLELQYLFIVPMVLGELIIPFRLLHLFNPAYTIAVPILLILAMASPMNALSLTFDNIIIGTDKTDATDTSSFSTYAKSKLFLVSKINLAVSSAYLASVAILTGAFSSAPVTSYGYTHYVFIGSLWAASALAMWGLVVGLKTRYVLQITKLRPPTRDAIGILLGSVGYAFVMYIMSNLIHVSGGAIFQALEILAIGIVSLVAYSSIVLATSNSLRNLARYAIKSLRG